MKNKVLLVGSLPQINNNNNLLLLLTAIGLSPGGSSYFTCTQI
jgi:hypothetical protein